MEDLEIESQMIEAHDEVGTLKLLDQIEHLLFVVDPIIASSAAVSHSDAHPHVANLVPAADFLGGFLCFEVKIDDVLHSLQIERRILGKCALPSTIVFDREPGRN